MRGEHEGGFARDPDSKPRLARRLTPWNSADLLLGIAQSPIAFYDYRIS